MSIPSLRQLTIANLRGATVPFTLPFDKNKKLTIIYGENATGKSTICDAFELLGKGNVGSLDNRGLGQVGKFWPSVGKTAGDVSVTLETTDNAKCCAKIATGGVTISPPTPRPRVEVLRRRQILALIEATEGKRYDEIRRFIDVSGVEASEGALNQLIKGLNATRDIAAARISENQDTLNTHWIAAGQLGADALTWAATEAKRDQSALDKEATALNALQAAYANLTDYPAQLTATTNAQDTAKTNADAALDAAKKCAQTIAADAGEMIGILGPNGAGKSTLLSVVSGLLKPSAGTVKLYGSEIHRMPPAERARTIAVVPQELDVPVPYTVEEIVMMGRTSAIGRFSSPTAEDR
ncbi:MAG: ATP-binding cassette domain-containing protein, partial [Kiritimatiellia bacterium]